MSAEEQDSGITLMIDNYDSFTYNIVQYLSQLGANVVVYRNDELSVSDALALNPHNVVISPGPGTPSEAGISKSIISAFAGKVPVLGVCLGHQSIIELYGGEIIRCPHIMHGKVSAVYHDEKGIYAGIGGKHDIQANNFSLIKQQPSNNQRQTYNQQQQQQQQTPFTASFLATRYHSLVGNPVSLPSCLIVTSYVEESQSVKSSGDGSEMEEKLQSPSSSSIGHTIMGVRHNKYTVEGVQFHPESVTTQHGMEMLKNFLKLRGGQWDEAILL